MKEVFNQVMDRIFSFGTFVFLMFFVFVYILLLIGENEDRKREETRVATEACYSQGMVLVQSDAGPRCASPQSLVKVK